MTKRLTPAEKTRRAFWRAQVRAGRLTARTPAETADYLAMIERQRGDTEARGKRILAAYVADDARLQADREIEVKRRGGMDYGSRYRSGHVRHALAGPVPMPHGTPLASRIAARTSEFQRQLAEPWRDDEIYVKPRPWWQFWRPRWISYQQDSAWTAAPWRERWWQSWRKPRSDGE